METYSNPAGPLRRLETVVPRWSRIGCIGLICLVVVSSLPGATKRTARLPQGTVSETMELKITRPVPPGNSFVVELTEPGVEVALAAPTGETVSPPAILTNAFAVDETSLPRGRAGTPPLRRIRFRAVEDLPPGSYLVRLSGKAVKRSSVSAAYVPLKDRKLRAPQPPGFGKKLGNAARNTGSAVIFGVAFPMVAVSALISSPKDFVYLMIFSINAALDAIPWPSRRPVASEVVWNLKTSEGKDLPSYGNRYSGSSIIVLVQPDFGDAGDFPIAELTARVEPIHGSPASQSGPERAIPIPLVRSREWKGWYEGVLRPTVPGRYVLHATLRASSSDRARRLTGDMPFPIDSPSARLFQMEERLLDRNKDGRPEGWEVLARVSISRRNVYDAVLPLGEEGASAECRPAQSVELDPGEHTLRFAFTPTQIRNCLPAGGRFRIPAVRLLPRHVRQGYREPVQEGRWLAFPVPKETALSRDLSQVDWDVATEPDPNTFSQSPGSSPQSVR